MVDRLFPILGGTTPPMLGRQALLQHLLGALTKSTPDHLQVVGPRFSGKTVILHELAVRLRKSGTTYSAVLLWDLGHKTPVTDELFMQRFCQELVLALSEEHPDYATHLKSAEGNPYQEIAEVLDLLKEEDVKVLAIMDGFDKPLSNGQLTRNLWDQLRELALKPSLRLVTASRRTLRDLIRHPDAQTSDFWNIFDPSPVRVGCFNEDDLNAILGGLDGVEFTAGAKTELWNATNGFPVCLLELLNVVCTTTVAKRIENSDIVNGCVQVQPSVRDIIEILWSDCTASSQDLLRRIIEDQSVNRSGIAQDDINALVERGFSQQSGSKLQRPSRLVSDFLNSTPNEGNALIRLFGNADAYCRNLKGVLERRIFHIDGLDPILQRYLVRGVEDLPEQPELFFSNIRGFIDQSFEMIWSKEIGRKLIPSEWMSIWKYNQERGMDGWDTRFPQGVHRVRLLNLMTGTERSSPCAKYVTKNTYVLVNAVHAFGDFGQHREGVVIDSSTAYSALLLCIELAASITRELLP